MVCQEFAKIAVIDCRLPILKRRRTRSLGVVTWRRGYSIILVRLGPDAQLSQVSRVIEQRRTKKAYHGVP
jgi:hypothetical protein